MHQSNRRWRRITNRALFRLLVVCCVFFAGCSSDDSPTSRNTTPIQEPAATPQSGSPQPGTPTPALPPLVDDPLLYEQDEGRLIAPRLVVVVLEDRGPQADAVAVELAAQFGGTVAGSNPGLGIAQIMLPDELGDDIDSILAELNADLRVFSASLSTAYEDPVSQAPTDWSDDFWNDKDPRWPIDTSGVDQLWNQQSRSAPDVGVLIVDFGIFDHHPDLDFALPVFASSEATPEQRLIDDPYGSHGTHVAGIACGSANGLGMVGVAQGCDLYGLDLLSPMPKSSENIVMLLDETVKAHPQIRVVNMSFGVGPTPANDCKTKTDPGTIALYRRLFADNPDVLWVASAGNCGMNVPILNDAELDEEALVPFPAGAAPLFANVVAVTSLDEDLTLADTANFGPAIGAAAPGGQSASGQGVWAPVAACDGAGCSTTWESKQGTSMAAPHWSGLAALLLQQNPTMTPADVVRCASTMGSSIVDTAGALECARAFIPLAPGLNSRPLEGFVYTTFVKNDDSRGSCLVGMGWVIPAVSEATFYGATIASDTDTIASGYMHQDALHIPYRNPLSRFSTQTITSADQLFGGPSSLIDFTTGLEVAVPQYGLIEGNWFVGRLHRQCDGVSPSNAADLILVTDSERAAAAVSDARFYIWVQPDVPAANAAVEFDSRQIGDRCEYIEWWSLPANAPTTTVLLYSNHHDGTEIKLRPAQLDNQVPTTSLGGAGAVTADRFKPYSTPGRVAQARTTGVGPPGQSCDYLRFLASQKSHVELVGNPMQAHCQMMNDPSEQIDFALSGWPSQETTCYWTEHAS